MAKRQQHPGAKRQRRQAKRKRNKPKQSTVPKPKPQQGFTLWMSNLSNGQVVEIPTNSFTTVNELTPFQSVVVPVLVDDGEQITCAGTAFNIAPDGLWVTARHVVDYATELMDANPKASLYIQWVEPEESGPLSDQEAERLPAHLLQPLRRGAMIAVTHFVKDDPNASDLALLRAGMDVSNEPQMSALCRRIRRIPQTTPREFPICRLSARVPKTGTSILAQGYSRFTVASDTTAENLREIAFKHNFSFSTGQVLEVYPQGRDTFRDFDGNYTGKLPTVCFETSARFEPGMSGGPVMDEAGAICGIVATGFESKESASDRSFASGTPFLYAMRIAHGPGDSEDRDSIYELVEAGAVLSDSYFEKLTITKEDHLYRVDYPCE